MCIPVGLRRLGVNADVPAVCPIPSGVDQDHRGMDFPDYLEVIETTTQIRPRIARNRHCFQCRSKISWQLVDRCATSNS